MSKTYKDDTSDTQPTSNSLTHKQERHNIKEVLRCWMDEDYYTSTHNTCEVPQTSLIDEQV